MPDNRSIMDMAVKWARKGGHNVFPNPRVGAIFVKNNKILARGYHQQYGEAHAEVNAIKRCKNPKALKGSTLFVTLEPCSHNGKQPPCTEALKKIGIKKVIYAQIDPNPIVASNGIQFLKKNNIQTEYLSTHASQQLNESYLKNTWQKRPFIEIKTALTANGKITLKKRTHSKLSNDKSNERVQTLRKNHDGILVGLNTILSDNPRLTVRDKHGKSLPDSPTRIILDSQLKTPPRAQIFKEPGQIILATTQSASPNSWNDRTIILTCKATPKGQIDLNDLLKKLLALGIRSVLVEGGEKTNTSFLKNGLADRINLCLTPHLSRALTAPGFMDTTLFTKLNLSEATLEILDNDLWIRGNLNSST